MRDKKIEELPFRISAGLKDIIGKELIVDDNVAIFELVKNAYDAGAKNATILFENTKFSQNVAKITIFDDIPPK